MKKQDRLKLKGLITKLTSAAKKAAVRNEELKEIRINAVNLDPSSELIQLNG